MTITSWRGLPERVPFATHEDVRIYTWNCIGIPRAIFRLNLFTLRTITNFNVIVLIKTSACQGNARQLLNQAHRMNYSYTNTLGFVGGVSVLGDTFNISLYGFHTMQQCVLPCEGNENKENIVKIVKWLITTNVFHLTYFYRAFYDTTLFLYSECDKYISSSPTPFSMLPL